MGKLATQPYTLNPLHEVARSMLSRHQGSNLYFAAFRGRFPANRFESRIQGLWFKASCCGTLNLKP